MKKIILEKNNRPNSNSPKNNLNLLVKISSFLSTAGTDDKLGRNSLEILAALSLLRKLAYSPGNVQKHSPLGVPLAPLPALYVLSLLSG